MPPAWSKIIVQHCAERNFIRFSCRATVIYRQVQCARRTPLTEYNSLLTASFLFTPPRDSYPVYNVSSWHPMGTSILPSALQAALCATDPTFPLASLLTDPCTVSRWPRRVIRPSSSTRRQLKDQALPLDDPGEMDATIRLQKRKKS